MRIYSLLQLLLILIAFGTFYFFIEPMLSDNLVIKFLVFSMIWYTLTYIFRKAEGHFAFLDKRLDKDNSIWIVIVLISIFIFIGFFF